MRVPLLHGQNISSFSGLVEAGLSVVIPQARDLVINVGYATTIHYVRG